jgi:hypothetical protein
VISCPQKVLNAWMVKQNEMVAAKVLTTVAIVVVLGFCSKQG